MAESPRDPPLLAGTALPVLEAEGSGDEGELRGGALRKRSAVSFVIAIGILLFFISRLDIKPLDIWTTVQETDVRLVVVAFLAFYAAFPVRAMRWRLLLRSARVVDAGGTGAPSLAGLSRMIFLSWFVNCIIPAKLGDFYRAYQLRRAARASFSATMGTILAERLLDIVVLVGLLVAALPGASGFSQGTGEMADRVVEAGLMLVVLGAAGLAGMWFFRERLHRLLPVRVRDKYLHFQRGTLGSFGSLAVLIPLSVGVWLGESTRLFLVIQALNVHLGFPYAIFLALANSLLTLVPFTPGGLGLVEAGIVGLLLLVGIDKELAVGVALIDRVVSYWSIIALGLPLFLGRRRL